MTDTLLELFYLSSPSNRSTSATSCYQRHERTKSNKYEKGVLEVKKATFTPLVFNTSGGASPLTTTVLKHLASLLFDKCDLQYCLVLGWLWGRVNFSPLRAAITCICGSQTIVGHAHKDNNHDLTDSETQILL